MKVVGKSVIACLLFFCSASAFAVTPIEVVTFNVKWFGAKYSNPRSRNPEPIDPKITKERFRVMRDFMTTVVLPRDVVAFQEVVDIDMIRATLPNGWTCGGYDHPNPNHQSVVVCASPDYKFLPVPYDRNAVIEEVASDSDWSRPAVRFDLANRSGKRLLRIVAVHLKAMPEFTKERVRQARVIAADLKKDRRVPTVVLGDMNSYEANQTGLPAPDLKFLQDALREVDPSFVLLNHGKFTYRSSQYRSRFDQIFANGLVKVNAVPAVFPVCGNARDGEGYLNFQYYSQYVADHCPVKVGLVVP